MFLPDEQAIQIPQESGADVWRNGRTGEMANFAVFKVDHHKDSAGTVHYSLDAEGEGIVPHPFTNEVQRLTFILQPPPDHLLRASLPYVPESTMVRHRPKPRVKPVHQWPLIVATLLGIGFWVIFFWLLWRVVVSWR